ncbi:hypothetical protein ACFQL1_02250 [Halomicroarcula sp. GCM10025709]
MNVAASRKTPQTATSSSSPSGSLARNCSATIAMTPIAAMKTVSPYRG